MGYKNNLKKDSANERQRFSIRKLTIGAASVLVGTTLFQVNGGVQVHADAVDQQVVKNNDTDNSAQEVDAIKATTAVNKDDETLEVASSSEENQDGVSVNTASNNQVANQDQQPPTQETVNNSDVNAEANSTPQSQTSVEIENATTELNTLITSANPATVNLAESKAVAPAKEQVTATINIYDDTSDPETSDPAFSITWTGDKGTTIKQAVQERIDNDMKGYTISPAVDNQSRISDIVNSTGQALIPNGSWTVNGGQEEYNKWLTDKNTNHKLAGYEIATDQAGDVDINTAIENGGNYDIDLVHQQGVLNKIFFQEYDRTVYFKYYYHKSDSNTDVADPVTKDGTATSYNVDGKTVANPNSSLKVNNYPFTEADMNSSTVDLTKVESLTDLSENADRQGIGKLSGAKTWITDIDKLPKDVNGVLSYVLVGRKYDLVTGLPNPMGNVEQSIANSSIIQFPEVNAAKASDGWETFDPNVPETTKDGLFMTPGGNTYAISATTLPGHLLHDGKDVTSPTPEYLYYYHNQPVDITDNLELSKFNATDLTVRKNCEYIPQKWKSTANKNTNYTAYSYKADDNSYQLTSQVSAGELSQKIGKEITLGTDGLNYQSALQKYLDNGFVLVSEDPDNLTYNADDLTQPSGITYHADNDKDTFDQVTQPTITKDSGDLKGTWKVFKSTKDTWNGTEYTDDDATIAPEENVPSTVVNGSHKDVYLVYRQQVAYNVHYRDVTDQYNSGKTSGFSVTDGTDLGHEIHDINGSVGETPDDEPSQPAPKNPTSKKHEKHITTHVTKESKKETKATPKSVTHKSVKKTSKYTESNVAAKGERVSRQKNNGLTLLAPKSEKAAQNRAVLAETNGLGNNSSSSSASVIEKVASENSKEGTLPQTGEKNDKASFLGAMLGAASLVTLVGLAIEKKRRN